MKLGAEGNHHFFFIGLLLPDFANRERSSKEMVTKLNAGRCLRPSPVTDAIIALLAEWIWIRQDQPSVAPGDQWQRSPVAGRKRVLEFQPVNPAALSAHRNLKQVSDDSRIQWRNLQRGYTLTNHRQVLAIARRD